MVPAIERRGVLLDQGRPVPPPPRRGRSLLQAAGGGFRRPDPPRCSHDWRLCRGRAGGCAWDGGPRTLCGVRRESGALGGTGECLMRLGIFFAKTFPRSSLEE